MILESNVESTSCIAPNKVVVELTKNEIMQITSIDKDNSKSISAPGIFFWKDNNDNEWTESELLGPYVEASKTGFIFYGWVACTGAPFSTKEFTL